MEVIRDGDPSEEGIILSGGVYAEDGADAEPCFWGFSSQRGKVAKFDADGLDSRALHTLTTRGSPTGIAVDAREGRLYVADVEHCAILKADVGGTQFVSIVQDYENERLLGPSSIALGPDGTIFFTDSGPLGESSIENPAGSIFAITRDENGQILRPLALHCLAHPCGIAVASDGTVYVCETLKNRVLRLHKRPHGPYICSVLHQFSGRLGPTALAHDSETGFLYVARFDFECESALVSVIDPSGAAGGHVRDIQVPEAGGSQVSALVIRQDTREVSLFEATSGRVVRFPL